MLGKELRILKVNQYSYDTKAFELAAVPQKAPFATIIKRYQIDYSFEQKFKLGIITGPEYMAWQAQLYEESLQKEEKSEKKNHTFWEDDEGIRENVSEADYDSFLAVNDLNVSNNAMVDIDAIIRESQAAMEENYAANDPEEDTQAQEAETAAAEALPGDDDPNRVLTPDEIAALFAAMGTGG